LYPDDGLFDLPAMDAPMRDEFLITEPNALIQSQEIGSAPSQIDKSFTAILESLLMFYLQTSSCFVIANDAES